MRLSVLRHDLVISLLLIVCQTQVSSPTEVCCCPDFTLSLSAKESSSTKSLQNGFLYVTEQGSDVSLHCELGDKDHPAVENVVYKYHKTFQLGAGIPISLDSDSNMELKFPSTESTQTSTYTLQGVKYTDNPDMQINMDKGDNQIYQCSATITLKDGGEVLLWSHTIKLDVYYPPVKSPNIITDTKTVSKGKAMEKFECDLPDSNPKTKAQWSFRKNENDPWQIIDIPNDTTRGSRLTIVEEKIEAGVTDSRGTLMVMIFNPDEDVGFYKCEGVYDTVFDVAADVAKFEIANFELKWTAFEDSGVLQLKPISAITYPKLVDQDSSVNFTVYARDTPGRGNYGDVTYTWQMDNANIDFKASPHLELSNNGRTLTVNKLSDYVSKSFSCQMERSKPDTSLDTATSSTMGFRNDDVVIAPKFLSIPINSKTCVNIGNDEQLTAKPNRAYMMPTAALAGANPKQLLLKADNFKYYINGYGLSFITDNEKTNYDNDTNAGITETKFESALPARKNDRCVYWQYIRSYGLHYQVIEVLKTYRMTNNGCNMDGDLAYFEDVKIKNDNRVVVVTFTDVKLIETSQCLTIYLVESNEKVLDSKTLLDAISTSSCSSRQLPEKIELDATKSEDTDLKIKICPETSPNECFTKSVVPETCARPEFSSPIKNVVPITDVAVGEKFTVECEPNHTPEHDELTCQEDFTLGHQPNCLKEGSMDSNTGTDSDTGKTEIIVGVVVGIVVVVALILVFLVLNRSPNEETDKVKPVKDGGNIENNVTYANMDTTEKDAENQFDGSNNQQKQSDEAENESANPEGHTSPGNDNGISADGTEGHTSPGNDNGISADGGNIENNVTYANMDTTEKDAENQFDGSNKQQKQSDEAENESAIPEGHTSPGNDNGISADSTEGHTSPGNDNGITISADGTGDAPVAAATQSSLRI